MWEEFCQPQNLTYSFTGVVTSGKMQFPNSGCTATLDIVKRDTIRNVSTHVDIPDENLSNSMSSVNHIHTHIIHPYAYNLIKFLFANHQSMHDNSNH